MSRFWPFRSAPKSAPAPDSKSAQITEANGLLKKCAIMRQVLNSKDNQFQGMFPDEKIKLNEAWDDLQDIAQSNAFFQVKPEMHKYCWRVNKSLTNCIQI